MEVSNYGPVTYYGPVTNGTGIGAGLLGTVATTIAGSNLYNSKRYINSVDVDVSDDYAQTIETLKEENEFLKTKVELLEIQFKFMLNKFTKIEKFMESNK